MVVQTLGKGEEMIDKIRELYDDWLKEEKWKKENGDPLYVYEVYEFLDYCERRWEEGEE